MKQSKPKISYDREAKVLIMEIRKGKSVDSDIFGNVVVDYDKKGEAVRISVYSFNLDSFRESSRSLKEFGKISRASLVVK